MNSGFKASYQPNVVDNNSVHLTLRFWSYTDKKAYSSHLENMIPVPLLVIKYILQKIYKNKLWLFLTFVRTTKGDLMHNKYRWCTRHSNIRKTYRMKNQTHPLTHLWWQWTWQHNSLAFSFTGQTGLLTAACRPDMHANLSRQPTPANH